MIRAIRNLERMLDALPASAASRAPGALPRQASDGVVPLVSTPWGGSFEAIDLDHLEQFAWLSSSMDAPLLYESIARRLAGLGF